MYCLIKHTLWFLISYSCYIFELTLSKYILFLNKSMLSYVLILSIAYTDINCSSMLRFHILESYKVNKGFIFQKHLYFIKIIMLIYFCCLCGRCPGSMHATLEVWRSEKNLQESVLSFHCVGPRLNSGRQNSGLTESIFTHRSSWQPLNLFKINI